MNGTQTATRIIAGVLPAMALFATPAFSQDLQTQTAPPPIPTQAAPVPAEPAPAPATTAPAGDAQARYQASLDAATGRTASADAPAAAEPAARGRSATRSTSSVARAARPAPAPAAAVVAPPAAIAPAATPPAPAAAPATAPVAAAPAPATDAAATRTATTTTGGTPIWAWLAGGLAALAAVALGLFALRRRREDEGAWAEDDAYVEPQAMAAPVAAAPHAHDAPVVERAEVTDTAPADVAAITDAAAPVAGRPWIELSLRPVRAGATDEAALVDLELTLANAGAVTARDVRVSTFMLGDAAAAPTEMERLLAAGHAGTRVDAGAIEAGEGSRIDARLAIPREEMADAATFQPVVVADVRYTLPDGAEGRTAAAFAVGVHDDAEEPTPLRLGGDMREDVAATLHGVPERV